MSASKEVIAWVEALPAEWIKCRDDGHDWKDHSCHLYDGAYDVIRKCQRCTTERIKVVHARTGERLATYYAYPEGYTASGTGGLTEADRNLLRLTNVRQTSATLASVKDASHRRRPGSQLAA
ncbi:hypothetical protein [Actinomadura atramentaria]|uniref:hypothetical protein n=1 Tax=Actinomadura atramentaria TaxID=1990 RepID=UPI0012F79D44|nr:hypothetical protein [Actinomadura atramentaria]